MGDNVCCPLAMYDDAVGWYCVRHGDTPLCKSCGSPTCPAAGNYVDTCPKWQEAEQRRARGEYLTTMPLELEDQD